MPLVPLEAASTLLTSGKLVAFATETVYGLGGDATNDLAVASIYAQKGRPQFNPLIVHFAEISSAANYVEFNKTAKSLAKAFWPGPLTLVLNRRPNCTISELCSAGGETLAVRVPSHPLARQLLEHCGKPIAAPSANSSGKISPTSPSHVLNDFGAEFPVFDGGLCDVGLESTVVDLSDDEPNILRPGSVTIEMIEQALGKKLSKPETPNQSANLKSPNFKSPNFKSPGMLTSHYAPDKPVRINATSAQPDTFFVAFGPTDETTDFNLSAKGDLLEAAANLFKALHLANASPKQRIAFGPIPSEGIGIAINDRLTRAAAPK